MPRLLVVINCHLWFTQDRELIILSVLFRCRTVEKEQVRDARRALLVSALPQFVPFPIKQQGITPLEVMLNNMRFYVEEADKLLAQILLGKKSTPALVEALKGLTAFRNQAQA